MRYQIDFSDEATEHWPNARMQKMTALLLYV